MDARLDRFQREADDLGNLRVAAVLKVAQDDDGAVFRGEGVDGGQDLSLQLLGLQGSLRRLLPVRDLEDAPLFGPQRRIQRGPLPVAPPVPLPEPVLALVERDLAQPGEDLALPPEGGEAAEGIDEGILRQVGRFIRVADVTQDQVV